MEDLVWGRHSVLEALRAGRPLNRIHILAGGEGMPREFFQRVKELDIPLVRVDRRRLDALSGGANHQGVVAQVAARDFVSLQEILEGSMVKAEPLFLLALDGVQDPGNLGALLRSAEGAGAHGVVVSARGSCGLTAAVSKASAGADAFMPVARVDRLDKALQTLKEAGVAVLGADMGGTSYSEADLRGPLVLVLGAEGEGLSAQVRQVCTSVVSLPLRGQVSSLNVSATGAVLLYEVVRQRG